MKSYKPAIAADQNVLQLDGVADIRKVSTLPIYTVGSCTVQVCECNVLKALLPQEMSDQRLTGFLDSQSRHSHAQGIYKWTMS